MGLKCTEIKTNSSFLVLGEVVVRYHHKKMFVSATSFLLKLRTFFFNDPCTCEAEAISMYPNLAEDWTEVLVLEIKLCDQWRKFRLTSLTKKYIRLELSVMFLSLEYRITVTLPALQRRL